MKRAVTVTVMLAAVAACNGSDATDSTTTSTTTAAVSTTTAPPTTTTTEAPTPTTVAPTTSAPRTTPAPSTTTATTAADSIEATKAEVAARYEEFSVAANECVSAPKDCDFPAVLSEYADPSANLYLVYEEWWQLGIDKGLTVQHLDRVKRSVHSIQFDGDRSLLIGCVIDGQVAVDETGAVVDDSISYREEDTIWERVDGEWRLVGGATYLTDIDDATCQF